MTYNTLALNAKLEPSAAVSHLAVCNVGPDPEYVLPKNVKLAGRMNSQSDKLQDQHGGSLT
jgi:hypothetical protein